jgi:predicted site-specific integrase-resolvase
MSDERWVILYAKNTSKKAKKWLDGRLTAQYQGARTRVQVYDDMGSLLEEVRTGCF